MSNDEEIELNEIIIEETDVRSEIFNVLCAYSDVNYKKISPEAVAEIIYKSTDEEIYEFLKTDTYLRPYSLKFLEHMSIVVDIVLNNNALSFSEILNEYSKIWSSDDFNYVITDEDKRPNYNIPDDLPNEKFDWKIKSMLIFTSVIIAICLIWIKINF